MSKLTLDISPILLFSLFASLAFGQVPETPQNEIWQLVDDFESPTAMNKWIIADPDNQTDPYVKNPQVAELRAIPPKSNHFLLKKPAEDGVIGNRKALTFKLLPHRVEVGETYTFYTRINIESFPNNHSFGLSNLLESGIVKENYNAFEPMIRITDKLESNGEKNSGVLMVSTGHKTYAEILGPRPEHKAKPMQTGTWYELWYVVNNASSDAGGQTFDLYVRGGEFDKQVNVYSDARFRMAREQPLRYFVSISNTGSVKAPYGNGGLRFDDIYMSAGVTLTSP